MKILLYVIASTILEAIGDAVIRMSLHSGALAARIGLFAVGATLLTAYGTTLNLAPVDFGTITGIYVALVFVSFQVSNYIFFKAVPHTSTLVGGAFILVGGTIVYIWR